MKNKISWILVLFLLIFTAHAQDDTFTPEFDDQDPSLPVNYDNPNFYENVPPSQWNWDYVNWNHVDLQNGELYSLQPFYDKLPSDKFKEIDYNQVDFSMVDQVKIDSGKFFKDKQCSNCQLDKGGFTPGADFHFTENGLEHVSGYYVTLPGGYSLHTHFVVTNDKIISNWEEALMVEGSQSVEINDNVQIKTVDVGKRYELEDDSALDINGITLHAGTVDVIDGLLYIDVEEDAVIEDFWVGGSDKIQLLRPEEDVPESGSYVRIGDENSDGVNTYSSVDARGNDLIIHGQSTTIRLGDGTQEGTVHAHFHEYGSEKTDLEAKGIFNIKTKGWTPFFGNDGIAFGNNKDSYLSMNSKTVGLGEGSGSFVAGNEVTVRIAGNAKNYNPYANEGGGAMGLYVGDMEVDVINSPKYRTSVSFTVPEEKVAYMSSEEKEEFYYNNAEFKTWEVSNCDQQGYCDFKKYGNRDFTYSLDYANYGLGSNEKSSGPYAFKHIPGINYKEEEISRFKYGKDNPWAQSFQAGFLNHKGQFNAPKGFDEDYNSAYIRQFIYDKSTDDPDYFESFTAKGLDINAYLMQQLEEETITRGVPFLEVDSNPNPDFATTPYVFTILEEPSDDEGDIKSPFGKEGEGYFLFDGYQGMVVPQGESQQELLDRTQIDKNKYHDSMAKLQLDGNQIDDELSVLNGNFHKKNFEKTFSGVKITCEEKECSPGDGLGGYYYWRVNEELTTMADYTGGLPEEGSIPFKIIDFKQETTGALGWAHVYDKEKGKISLNKPAFGLVPTTLGHESLHWEEYENKYFYDPWGKGSAYTQRQNTLFDGFSWAIHEGENADLDHLTVRNKKLKYEPVTIGPHIFRETCNGECALGTPIQHAETMPRSYDLFAGKPESARDFLDPNSKHYQDIEERTRQKLTDSQVTGEEKEFYVNLDKAFSRKDPEVIHPATFHQQLLGYQLVDGVMSASYCGKHFAGSCTSSINQYMGIVKKQFKEKKIDEKEFLKLVKKADKQKKDLR